MTLESGLLFAAPLNRVSVSIFASIYRSQSLKSTGDCRRDGNEGGVSEANGDAQVEERVRGGRLHSLFRNQL